MRVVTVITDKPEAFPAAGCRIVAVQASGDGDYRFDLRIITFGGTEYTIASGGRAWGCSRPEPAWMTAQRDRIIATLESGDELLDLRQEDAERPV